MSSTSIPEICARIEAFFETLQEAGGIDLRRAELPPSHAAKVKELESQLGVTLPEDVRAFLARGLEFATGAVETEAGFGAIGFEFLGPDQILRATTILRDLAREAEEDEDFDEDEHVELQRDGVCLTHAEPMLVWTPRGIFHYSVRNPVRRVCGTWTEFLEAWLASGCFASHSYDALWPALAPALGTKPGKNAWLDYYRTQFPRSSSAAAARTPLRERFLAMVEELRGDERFEVTKFVIGEPASPELIAEAAKAAGGALPEGVAELYAEFNGLELVWKQVDGFDDDLEGEETDGYIDILPIYAPRTAGGVFSDWRGALYSSDDDPLKAMKPLDNSGGELGANTHAVFFPVPGEATIHYHKDGDLHPTGYTLEGYLERLLVSRGFRYWTGSLCVDLREDGAAEEFLHDAPLVFPDFDASLFVPATEHGQIEDFDAGED